MKIKNYSANIIAIFTGFLGFTGSNWLAFLSAPVVHKVFYWIISAGASVCGGGVNYFVTVDLFKSFFSRFFGGKKWREQEERNKVLLEALKADIRAVLKELQGEHEDGLDSKQKLFKDKLDNFVKAKLGFNFDKNVTDEQITQILNKIKEIDRTRQWRKNSVVLIFVISGIALALPAFAFGVLAVWLIFLGIVTSCFVCFTTIVQETETWLESFDPLNEKFEDFAVGLTKEPGQYSAPQSQVLFELEELSKTFWFGLRKDYFHNMFKSRKSILGFLLALFNNIGLSLLFTFGLVIFLTFAHVPVLIALIVSATIAFSCGFFTESYFYNKFIPRFVDEMPSRFRKLFVEVKKTEAGQQEIRHPIIGVAGLLICGINAGANGVATYFAIFFLGGIIAAVFPPLGAALVCFSLMPALISAAVTLTSFFLGVNFYPSIISKVNSFISFIKGDKSVEEKINSNEAQDKPKKYSVYVKPSCSDSSQDNSSALAQSGKANIGTFFLEKGEEKNLKVTFYGINSPTSTTIILRDFYHNSNLKNKLPQPGDSNKAITDEELIYKLVEEIKNKGEFSNGTFYKTSAAADSKPSVHTMLAEAEINLYRFFSKKPSEVSKGDNLQTNNHVTALA